jgi:hypothetical protein
VRHRRWGPGSPTRTRARPASDASGRWHAARQCYDHAYAGAGNWPFNTAWAGLHGVDAFVTRLRSLAEAEAFVAAGIPLIVSAAFRTGDVPGLDYDTRGHLMGQARHAAGDLVLNDLRPRRRRRRGAPDGGLASVWTPGSAAAAASRRPLTGSSHRRPSSAIR